MATLKIIKSRESYKDGAESDLLLFLKNSKDVSSSSELLQLGIKDWPTDYHLNLTRNNLLFPLEIVPGMKILDVGGGSGVATRYLAEKGASVVLLEGEISRALIAEERCRDLDNVEIVVGEINDLDKNVEFDLILIIGVLEYIGKSQSQIWLTRLNQFLKNDGTLALAIENRIGLKYFLGYPEDHTGRFWDGIFDYYGKDSLRTYSKTELNYLLNVSGFQNKYWWYPFPDYKMPTTLVSEEAFRNLNSDQIGNNIKTPFHAAGSGTLLDFNHKILLSSISKSGILEELSNSFFVICRKDQNKINKDGPILYKGDENYRKNKYRRVTKLNFKNNELNWEYELISHCNQGQSLDEFIDFKLKNRPFFHTTNLYEAIRQDQCITPELLILQYKEIIPNILNSLNIDKKQTSLNPYLPLEVCKDFAISNFDINLKNFTYNSSEITFFDDEWGSTKGVCLELALCRALFENFWDSIEIWNIVNFNNKAILFDEISKMVSKILGTTHHEIEDFIEAEVWFYSIISKNSLENKLNLLRSALLSNPYRSPNEALPLSGYAFEIFTQRFDLVKAMQLNLEKL